MKPQTPFTNKEPFWESKDKLTQILRHCDGIFSLVYKGEEVFPSPSSFEKCANYVWAEFMIDF